MEAAEGHRAGPLVAIMLYCGLRPGEVTGLTWDCIDFRRHEVVVRQSRSVRPDGTMVIGATKAYSDRVQQIPDSPAAPVLGLLREHQVAQKKARLASKAWQDDDLVFPNEIGRPDLLLEPPKGGHEPMRGRKASSRSVRTNYDTRPRFSTRERGRAARGGRRLPGSCQCADAGADLPSPGQACRVNLTEAQGRMLSG